MMTDVIAFIGGGNMAASLIGGLLADGYPAHNLWVSEPDPDRLRYLQERFAICSTQDNKEAASRAETIVFAVKPQLMSRVVQEIAAIARERQILLVSIAAGVREADIRRWLGFEAAVVRTMPNTPALVGSAATALFANPFVDLARRNRAESILRAVGLTLWVENEELLDAVTALSGSGPAYLFLIMELMQNAGQQLGIPPDMARLLTLQTAFGAAKMALESPEELSALRARVTSPGGTTERAVEILRQGEIERLFTEALKGARDRAAELGKLLGGN
jgi:pyrroline-5-carboxylate reductase